MVEKKREIILLYNLLKKERQGKFLGKTVQFIPHVTDKIKSMITETANIPIDSSNKIPEICSIIIHLP